MRVRLSAITLHLKRLVSRQNIVDGDVECRVRRECIRGHAHPRPPTVSRLLPNSDSDWSLASCPAKPGGMPIVPSFTELYYLGDKSPYMV